MAAYYVASNMVPPGPDLRCGSSRHSAAVASLGVPGIVFYVVGVPVGLMALLWWRRDDLHADEPRRAQELMWFVYGDYDPAYFYWEAWAYTLRSIPGGTNGGQCSSNWKTRVDRRSDPPHETQYGVSTVYYSRIGHRHLCSPGKLRS